MSVRTLGVVGTGTMGGGIAQVAATAGLQVIAVDVSEAALSSGLRRLTAGLDRLVKKGTLDVRQRDEALAAVKMGTSYDALNEADIVIEAATENAELKADIVKRVNQAVRATAVIASTTSSISITKLAALVSDPSRFIGLHFFNPVPALHIGIREFVDRR